MSLSFWREMMLSTKCVLRGAGKNVDSAPRTKRTR